MSDFLDQRNLDDRESKILALQAAEFTDRGMDDELCYIAEIRTLRLRLNAANALISELALRLGIATDLLFRWADDADGGRLDGVDMSLLCETEDFLGCDDE